MYKRECVCKAVNESKRKAIIQLSYIVRRTLNACRAQNMRIVLQWTSICITVTITIDSNMQQQQQQQLLSMLICVLLVATIYSFSLCHTVYHALSFTRKRALDPHLDHMHHGCCFVSDFVCTLASLILGKFDTFL